MNKSVNLQLPALAFFQQFGTQIFTDLLLWNADETPALVCDWLASGSSQFFDFMPKEGFFCTKTTTCPSFLTVVCRLPVKTKVPTTKKQHCASAYDVTVAQRR